MPSLCPAVLLLVLLPAFATAQPDDPYLTAQAAAQTALEAYETQAYPAFLTHIRAAQAALPNHPRLTYLLARAHALNNQPEAALQALHHYADLGLVDTPEADSTLALLHGTPGFRAVLTRIAVNQTVIGTPDTAFTLPEPDFIPEAVAFDPVQDAFYVGSVRKGKIVRVQGGEATDFATGLWSVLGLQVDARRRHLWACSSAFVHTEGLEADEIGQAGLFQYDLDTGRLLKRHHFPAGEVKHNINDLTLATDGTVYVSNPGNRILYRLLPEADSLQPWIGPGPLPVPQGLALSEDERHLYVADYARGLYRIDVATKVLAPVSAPDTVAVTGIDGLTRYGNTLLAIQNGIRPYRVVQYHLTPDGTAITHMTRLANNLPYDEPTLGTVVDHTFYYVANSQWNLFDRAGTLPPKDQLQGPLILKIEL